MTRYCDVRYCAAGYADQSAAGNRGPSMTSMQVLRDCQPRSGSVLPAHETLSARPGCWYIQYSPGERFGWRTYPCTDIFIRLRLCIGTHTGRVIPCVIGGLQQCISMSGMLVQQQTAASNYSGNTAPESSTPEIGKFGIVMAEQPPLRCQQSWQLLELGTTERRIQIGRRL